MADALAGAPGFLLVTSTVPTDSRLEMTDDEL